MATAAEPLVVWINGAFGVGKTSVAEELVALLPGAVVFDPELIGSLLRSVIPADEQTDDFQDLRAWRELARAAVSSLARTRSGPVVVPMTLVDELYFDEIVGGIRAAGMTVVHATLVAPEEVVEARLRARSEDESWALGRVGRCCRALAAPCFSVHLDATTSSPRELAGRLAELMGENARVVGSS